MRRVAGAFALGAIVGVLGTVMHRSVRPWGLVVCLVLVLAAAVTSRAWGGLVALIGYSVGWCAIVALLSLTGPGGDVLIPAGGGRASELLGQAWVLGGWLPIAVTAFLPGRWFSDQPRHAGPQATGSPEVVGHDDTALH